MRVGLDLDGTLADLRAPMRALENRLRAADAPGGGVDSGDMWDAIQATEDFWLSLEPLESGIVRRLFEVSLRLKWEVFFVTQRPRTAGDAVQRQTQLWLIKHGFETPSVLTLSGSRGFAASVLELDVLVDDTPKNCLDVRSDSRCRPILVMREPDAKAEGAAKRLGIAIVRSVSEALDVLETAGRAHAGRPGGAMTAVMKRLGLK